MSDRPTPETDDLDFRAKDPSKAELAALKAAQPSGYLIEEVSSSGYSVGGAGGSGPSAISDERIMQIAKSVGMQGMLSDIVTTTDELKAFARAVLAAAQEGK